MARVFWLGVPFFVCINDLKARRDLGRSDARSLQGSNMKRCVPSCCQPMSRNRNTEMHSWSNACHQAGRQQQADLPSGHVEAVKGAITAQSQERVCWVEISVFPASETFAEQFSHPENTSMHPIRPRQVLVCFKHAIEDTDPETSTGQQLFETKQEPSCLSLLFGRCSKDPTPQRNSSLCQGHSTRRHTHARRRRCGRGEMKISQTSL